MYSDFWADPTKQNIPAAWYGSRISLADQGVFGVAGEPGAFVEPS